MRPLTKFRTLLIISLIATMATVGCSTSWLTTFDSWLAIAGPAVINILELVALARGVTVPASVLAKVNGDSASLKVLATSVNSAVAADLPNACAAFNQGVQTFVADLPTLASIGQISNPTRLAQITDGVNLAQGVFSLIEAPISACADSSPTTAQANFYFAAARTRFTSQRDFLGKYNEIMARDAVTKKLQIHQSSKPVRWLTLGFKK